MEIITPPHKTASRKVIRMEDIVDDMNAMMKMVKEHPEKYSVLHHSQVSKKPYNFFVITPMLRPLFKQHWAIFNPKIINFTDRREVEEYCSSYPNRKSKKVVRYNKIRVSCLVESPDMLGGFAEEVFELGRMPAYLMQHQMDHAQGKRLFDK